mmetsp:Transcript_5464/g.22652  ORF Transcript_5464/g.22652 Transcript_5464/m.22652 type:complete len:90 (-) Transcript_5464:1593-1862(-)
MIDTWSFLRCRVLECGDRAVVALRGLHADAQAMLEDLDLRLRLRWIAHGFVDDDDLGGDRDEAVVPAGSQSSSSRKKKKKKTTLGLSRP